METTLLDQGISLMLVGMGTVFFFLTILVLAMSAMAAIATRLLANTSDVDASNEEIAAISAAITQHRKKTG